MSRYYWVRILHISAAKGEWKFSKWLLGGIIRIPAEMTTMKDRRDRASYVAGDDRAALCKPVIYMVSCWEFTIAHSYRGFSRVSISKRCERGVAWILHGCGNRYARLSYHDVPYRLWWLASYSILSMERAWYRARCCWT